MNKAQVVFSGENFGEYLLTHDLDCELMIADMDSPYSFCHDRGDNFTAEGRAHFAPILNAAFDFLENGNIIVHCDNEALAELFMAAYAGYIGNSTYLKWFKK